MLDQWYWIMPNKILFNKELWDKEKLLFCFISSLCAEKWYCRASNQYIAEQMWISERTVREHIWRLAKHWCVTLKIEKWNQRSITIWAVAESCHGGGENLPPSGGENLPHNNTSNNIKREYTHDVILFEEFRIKYPNKKWKAEAMKKRNKMTAEEKDKAYKSIDLHQQHDDSWKRWFIPHGSTYLNQKRREDEFDTKPEKPKTIMYH